MLSAVVSFIRLVSVTDMHTYIRTSDWTSWDAVAAKKVEQILVYCFSSGGENIYLSSSQESWITVISQLLQHLSNSRLPGQTAEEAEGV